MKLEEAAKRFEVPGLDLSLLKGQENAFQICQELLAGIESRKTQNPSHGSYGYKHMVENPASKLSYEVREKHGFLSSRDFPYLGYVYEGTFILAALAAGFERKSHRGGLSCSFNISEPSLKKELLALALANRN